jgi:putative SOS response-associated peptidase YedK
MPVILKPEAYQFWLDRENQDVRLLQELIRKQVYTKLESMPVSKQVNSVKVNRPENINPVEAAIDWVKDQKFSAAGISFKQSPGDRE